MVKSRYIGDGHPTFNRNPYNGYINPYYWVDDHPLLYGNNGSLDPSTNGVVTFSALEMERSTWVLSRDHIGEPGGFLEDHPTYQYYPWDWYIYLHEWLLLMVKYGKCR